ncbi:MAG: hypothetical protein ACK4K7_08295 [Allosphingosinicella sp.]|uniref:hypothetical protein n=1 Tax=Allosphingosinicella sp. TaxID=2823234 RepID=UPI003925CC1C
MKSLRTFMVSLAVLPVAAFAALEGMREPSEGAASAAIAMERGDPAEAERLLAPALAPAPLDSYSLATLGRLRELQGRTEDAERIAQAGASLGPRGIHMQFWLLARAADRGDPEAVLLLADALLRQGQDTAELTDYLRSLSIDPAARQALAARLALRPGWRRAYMESLQPLPPDQAEAHGLLLADLQRTDAPPTEEESGAYVGHLMLAGRHDAARSARLALARGGPPPLLEDERFERLIAAGSKAGGSPFRWRVRQLPGGHVRLQRAEGDAPAAVRVKAVGSVAGPMLQQTLLLAPGRYSLFVEADEGKGSGGKDFDWTVTCANGPRSLSGEGDVRRPLGDGWVEIARSFAVPAADCPEQRVTLRASKQSPGETVLLFRRVSLRPL